MYTQIKQPNQDLEVFIHSRNFLMLQANPDLLSVITASSDLLCVEGMGPGDIDSLASGCFLSHAF